MPLYFPPNYLEAAERAAKQTSFPASVVQPSANRDRWVLITWAAMTSRWDFWFGTRMTLKEATRFCRGKFPRGGSPVRLVRVSRDGRITQVVDGFTGRNVA